MTGRAMGSHQSAAANTVEWLTPPHIIDALGGADSFDLDPCTPEWQPWPTDRCRYTRRDNGLLMPWEGRIYLNPPYSTAEIVKWLARMAQHDCGTALIFARTETETFFDHVWAKASAVLFIRQRLFFHVGADTSFPNPKGRGGETFVPAGGRAPNNAGAPSVLVAYGADDADILACQAIEGQFVPLRIPRSVLVEALAPTWREVVDSLLRQADGPVSLADLYRAIAKHPKAKANPHYAEKVRQVLQHGEGTRFRRVDRGLWASNDLFGGTDRAA